MAQALLVCVGLGSVGDSPQQLARPLAVWAADSGSGWSSAGRHLEAESWGGP